MLPSSVTSFDDILTWNDWRIEGLYCHEKSLKTVSIHPRIPRIIALRMADTFSKADCYAATPEKQFCRRQDLRRQHQDLRSQEQDQDFKAQD